MIGLIYLLVFNTFVFIAYFIFAAKLRFNSADRIVFALVLSSLQIIVTQTLLGILGILNPLCAQVCNAMISFLIIGFSLRLSGNYDFGSINLINPAAISNWKTLLFIALILVSYSLVLFLAVITPPFSWDSLTFHLPAVICWVKSSKLVLTQPIRHMSYYPQNGELFTLWIFLLTKKLNLLNLVQLPFAFLLAISTYSVSKKMNLSNSFLAFPLILLTPVIMIQATTSYVDIIFAAFFISTLNFLIGYFISKRSLYLILASISMGLFCGIKPVGWIASSIFIIFLIFHYLSNRNAVRARTIIGSILCVLIAGGFWYVRNLILTGNVNFPYNVRIFGITIMKGLKEANWNMYFEKWFVDNRWEWWFYPIYERIRGDLVYSIESGFGAQFILGVASVFYSFYIAIIKKDRLAFFVFTLFPATIFLLFNVQACPFPRYVLFLCALSALAIIYVHNHLKSLYKNILDAFIITVIFFSFLTVIFRINPHQERTLNYYIAHKNIPAYTYLGWEYGELADTWGWLDDNTEAGSVVAYNYTELITYLYGTKFNKNIVNINTSDNTYKNATRAASYEEWVDKLRYYEVSYYYLVTQNNDINNKHKDIVWIKEHPEIFIKLKEWPYSSFGNIALYKIQP